MSFTFIVMMMLLSSSVMAAFILPASEEEPAASANSHHRCHGESLQTIRKGLLRALNLQVEPQLPAGGLDGVREQWRRTFSSMAHRANYAGVPAVSASFVSPDDGNSASRKCCSVTSEVFMKDLGWDNWVIHPASLSIVQCAHCNPEMNTVQCPSSHPNVQDADTQVQVPCCQPTSQEMAPIVYMDEFGTIVVSSVKLTRSCGCGLDGLQEPSEKSLQCVFNTECGNQSRNLLSTLVYIPVSVFEPERMTQEPALVCCCQT